jgi:hypothetical protein
MEEAVPSETQISNYPATWRHVLPKSEILGSTEWDLGECVHRSTTQILKRTLLKASGTHFC